MVSQAQITCLFVISINEHGGVNISSDRPLLIDRLFIMTLFFVASTYVCYTSTDTMTNSITHFMLASRASCCIGDYHL